MDGLASILFSVVNPVSRTGPGILLVFSGFKIARWESLLFEGVGGVKYVTFYALSRRMDVGIIILFQGIDELLLKTGDNHVADISVYIYGLNCVPNLQNDGIWR